MTRMTTREEKEYMRGFEDGRAHGRTQISVGESISEQSWAKGWNDALDRVATSREAMNAAAHPGAFAAAVRALKVRP